ncbi:MAG: (2Fe-2S)-binding protein [Hyphomonas sp. BRH_c22]|uniref:Rieske (2Fe-2S) domain-containing protein n=1 Tax=Hyphomonas oceanitis SCH89 TaxID=1280953 RepID=A0A059G344_9PROT|nr:MULTISPECIES: non-heme iron oxygenase ferredoxin subunit [Hyphomonas]KDA01164.1 Rieske (2Fe-2S) domain-containing protein [Hyphomonas oceanitis SCH89]KJS38355.1 MAG: (2Fe-2S)-binding protein [Hyphomonas sp. BRH_c22]|tara:strand:+ start:225 stop:551 length:327 start_codon:yes stop_codon:yes gene_type:complete
MTSKVRLCPVADVKDGEPVGVFLDDLPALAVYNVNGDIFVTDNMCTHGNAMLTDGYQDGGIIECPFHGGSFDIATGAAKAFPCQVPVKTYAVAIEDGWVCIDELGGAA